LLTIVSVQVLVWSGWQLADHPAKTDPESATAVRLTGVFNTKFAVQPAPEPQLIPAGALVTVPVPWPTL
jgi:hypothetical protein